MKLLTLLCVGLAISCPAFGATLSSETPAHLKPDANAPVIATLPAGSSVTALLPEELRAEMLAELPEGWIAIRHGGPFYGYAPNSAVGKNLYLRPGSIVRTEPANDATMLTMVGADESAELVEVVGDWSKVVFSKTMIGFINPARANGEAEAAPESADDMETPSAAAGLDTQTNTEATTGPATTVIPPASSSQEPKVIDATPRVFQGYLMRTRRVLGMGPKLDYQLVDEEGRRIALLDLSPLLITEPLARYENHMVSVFGPVLRRPEVKDMIIRVQTLRLSQQP
ncbi:MAG: hypothetical protein ACREIA_20490 [Opitutaceae bacterium]